MERIPRPKGSTYLSIKHRETNSKEDKDTLYRHLVSTYTLNGFRWLNTPMNLQDFSYLLQIPLHKVMDLVADLGTHAGSLASPENMKNTIQALITLSTTWAIEDRGKALAQLDKLLISQGDTYKAFVSSEVNRTLKVLLESNKNLMEIYKTYFTSSTNITNILNIIGNSDDDTLTPDKALKLLESNKKGLPAKSTNRLASNDLTGELAEELKSEHGIVELSGHILNRSGNTIGHLDPTESPGAEEPVGVSVDAPSRHPRRDSFKRRNIPIEDADEIT